MNKSIKKRIVSLTIILTMILSLMPFSIFTSEVYAALPIIQNVSLSQDGILTWDPFPGAGSYCVRVGSDIKHVQYPYANIKLFLSSAEKPEGSYKVTLYAEDKLPSEGGVQISRALTGNYYYIPEYSYTVTFNSQGKGSPNIQEQKVKKGQKTSIPTNPVPTSPAYKFGGWYKDTAGTKSFDFNTSITEDITLYAKWIPNIYSAEFDNNGGTGSIVSIRVTPGEKLILPKCTFKAPSGKEFSYWYVPEATSSKKVFKPGEKVDIDSNVTVYAGWRNATSPTVTLNFAPGEYGSGTMDSIIVAKGDTFILPSCSFVSKNPDYVFLYWGVSTETNAKFAGETITIKQYADTVTITARWKKIQFPVTFELNGGAMTGTNPVNITKGGKVTRPAINPTKTGYTFDNWYTDTTYKTKFDFKNTQITEPITIYAKFISNTKYDVKFRDGDNTLSVLSIPEGEKIERPSEPTKVNYVFDDWYTDTTYKTKFNFDTPITKNTIIYAKFIKQYKITVDYNGGTNNGFMTTLLNEGTVLTKSNIELSFKDSSIIIPPTGKEYDYIEIDGKKWTENTYTLNSDIIMKIIWKDKASIKKCNITVNYNGGTNKGFKSMPLDKGTVLTRKDIENSFKIMVTPPSGKEFNYIEINGKKWTENTYTVNSDITMKIIWKDKVSTKVLLGDLNENGKVEANDAFMALQLSVSGKKPTTKQLQLGDIDGNSKVDAFDAYQILAYSVGIKDTKYWK